MAEMLISRQDMESFTQILEGLVAPAAPKELLSKIVIAIRDAMDEQADDVSVSVEPADRPAASFGDQFDSAFTPEAADAPAGAASGVKVTVAKIGRSHDT
jgi:hypothetical protein